MPKNGTFIAGGIVGIGLIFGIGMWYAQQRNYYEPVTGLTEVEIGGKTFEISGYDGVDGARTPLKLRGCFTLSDPRAAIAAGEPAPDARPLTTPDWITCFDEEAILADISNGNATAIMAGEDEGDGADLMMAIYPDGRAYQWRRANDKYAE